MGTTTRLTSAVVAPLLERDDALVVLHSSLSEVRSGVGRMLLVSGEAGIGKTALVRSFTASVRGSARVLEGACDALAAPRPLGAFVDIGGGSGDRLRELVAPGPVAARGVRGAVRGARRPAVRAGGRGRALGGRGDARRAARARPADRGRRRAGHPHLPRRRRRAGAPGAHAARRPRHRAGPRTGRAGAVVSPGRRRDGGRVRAGRGRAPPADRRQPVLRARGAGGGRRPGAGDGGRGGLHPRGADERGRPIGAGVGVGGAAGARALGARGGLRRGRGGTGRVPGRRHAGRRRRRERASATSSPGWRSRRSSGRPAGAGCTARCWPRWAIRPGASTRPAWPITPRERTTPLPCCSWRRSPRAVPRRSVRTARRRRSTHAPCGSPRRSPPPSGRSSRRGWPTRCMRPTTRSSRSPPASGRSSISARRAMRPARATPSVTWSPRTAAAA